LIKIELVYFKCQREEYVAVDLPYSKKNFRCDEGYAVIYSGDRMVQVILETLSYAEL